MRVHGTYLDTDAGRSGGSLAGLVGRNTLSYTLVFLFGVFAGGLTVWAGTAQGLATGPVVEPVSIFVPPTEYFPAQYVNQGKDVPANEQTH